jgi:hypothetical protein
MTTTTDSITLAETRAKRLQDIAEGYEVSEEGMPDATVPGAATPMYGARPERKVLRHPRYVLVTQYGDKGNYRLRLGTDKPNIEQLAADAVTDAYGAEMVICYFDLDVLAGDPPSPSEGDRVRLTDEGMTRVAWANQDQTFYVVGTETDTFDGVAYEKLYLSLNEGADYLSGVYDTLIDEQYVEVIEPAIEDERMPVRYGLARVVTQVVFNTIPSP